MIEILLELLDNERDYTIVMRNLKYAKRHHEAELKEQKKREDVIQLEKEHLRSEQQRWRQNK